MEQFSNHSGTTLSAPGITSTTRPVTFSVASSAGLPASGNFRVIIDSEILLITSISGTSLTGSNVEGTSPATHNTGAAVTHILTAGALQQVEKDVNLGVGAQTNVVAFSATPTFDASLGSIQQITLTGNVTSSSIINLTAGQELTFLIIQDATGGHTFAWPAGMHGPMTIGGNASKSSVQQFLSTTTAASGLYAVTSGVINQ